MIKLATRRLVLTGLGLLAVPVSVQAQATPGDMFGIPWSGVSTVELMDEGDLIHLSASRSPDFDRLKDEVETDRACRDRLGRLRTGMGADAHERALRSSDLIMAHLQASTFNRFTIEELTASRRTDMAHRFGKMTYNESLMINRGLDMRFGSTRPMAVLSTTPDGYDDSVPHDCQ